MCSWLPQDKGGNFQLSGGSHRYYDCHVVGGWSDKPLQACGNFCRGRFGARTLSVHMHTIWVYTELTQQCFGPYASTFSVHTLFCVT